MDELKMKAFFTILDDLRESGSINMFGAPRWLQDNFGLDKPTAQLVFKKWSESFDATS